jgi:hypothetical protein
MMLNIWDGFRRKSLLDNLEIKTPGDPFGWIGLHIA